MMIRYFPKTGKFKDVEHVPYQTNGKFVVSKSRFEKDYIYVNTHEEVINHLLCGYKIRMIPSCGGPLSLIKASSLTMTK